MKIYNAYKQVWLNLTKQEFKKLKQKTNDLLLTEDRYHALLKYKISTKKGVSKRIADLGKKIITAGYLVYLAKLGELGEKYLRSEGWTTRDIHKALLNGHIENCLEVLENQPHPDLGGIGEFS